MATQAFEEFRKKQKEASAPGGSSSNTPTPKRTSAFEEFQKSRQAKPSTPSPLPATPAKPSEPQFTQAAGGAADRFRQSEELPFGSRTSTLAIPTPEMVEATNAVIDPIVQKGQAVAAKAKEMRKSDSAGTRAIGALADSAIETSKSLVQKLDTAAQKPSALTLLDFGLNFATLGLADFVPDATPELAGLAAETGARVVPFVDQKKVGQAVQTGVRKGMDFLFGRVLYEGVGGAAASAYEAAFGELSPEDREAIKSIATIGTMVAGFKAVGKAAEVKGKRVADLRSANDLVAPMAESLGMQVKTDKAGNAILPDVTAIQAAHKKALMRAADEGGQFMYAKMDAFDTARQMLVDYKTQGAAGFAQKWQPVFENGSRLADEVATRAAVKTEDAKTMSEAAKVNAILTEPATPKTLRLKQELSQEAQFAFEQEMVDMNAANDPKLSKKAQSEGYGYERVDDPFDSRPAFYDALTNKISLNEPIIKQTLEGVWQGKVLKVGEGKTTTVFRKKPNETFEQMKTRYEQTLIDHESAHAKTITPEDVARLRAAVGDEVQLNKIRKELEDRANEFSFRKPTDLDEGTERAVDYTIERVQRGLNLKENLDSLKFPESEREAAYSRWKKIVQRSPDYARADWDQLEGGLKKSSAYKNKSVKALFEDALDREAVSSRSSVDSFDRLLTKFQERYKTERGFIEEYKTARAAQQKLIPDVKRNPAVERAVKREMRAEMKAQKLEGKGRKLEMRLLRERITRRLEKDVLKEKAAAAEQRLRSKITDKAAAQQDLVDFMKEAGVPQEVRGRFVTALKNAKTDADVKAIVTEIKTEFNKYERREKRGAIEKLLKSTKTKRDQSGKSLGKFTAEVQKKLNDIRKYAKADRNELNKEIISLVDAARSKMEASNDLSLDLPPEIAARIEILELGGLKDQSLTQLKRTEAVIKDLIEKGKTDRAADVKFLKDKISRFVDSALEQLTGSRSPREATQRSSKALQSDKWYRRVYNPGAIVNDLVREMGGALQNAGKELSEATLRAVNRLDSEKQAVEAKMTSLYGKKWEGQLIDIVNDQKDFGVMKNALGEDIEVRTTRGQAMSLYMRLKEQGSDKFIKEAERFVDEKGNERVAGLGYTDSIIKNMLSVLTTEDKIMADWLVKEGYAKWWKEVSPVFERRTGTPLGYIENFAGTRSFTDRAGSDDLAVGLANDMMDASISQRLSTTPNFVKSRVAIHGNLKLSNNPILDYLTYSKRASHYIEAGDVIYEWRSLLSKDKVRNAITDKYGKSFLEALQFAVDNATRNGYDMGGRESSLSKFFDEVGSNITSALLFSPRVWFGQLSSPAAFKAEMSLLPGKQGDFWRGLSNAKKIEADLLKYSSAYKGRFAPTSFELTKGFTGERGKLRRLSDAIKKKQAVPLERFDRIATRQGAAGVFEAQKKHYLTKGFDLEKAKELAGSDVSDIILRTQSTRHFAGKSQVETGALRYLVQLKQQPIKIARGGIEAFKLRRQGRITSKQLASYYVWNYGVQAALYVAFRQLASAALDQGKITAYELTGNEEAADAKREQRKKDLDPKNIGKVMAVNSVTSMLGFPVVGDIINTGIQNFAYDTNYEFRPTLFNVLVDDLYAARKQWADGDVDEAGVLSIRAVSRSAGLGDPGDLIKWTLGILSAKNKERKAKLRQTPEYKQEAAEKRAAKALEKQQAELAKRKKKAGIK